MTDNPGLLLTIIAFILLLGPLVFVHEMGHYLAGRWCGVKADAFSIGFGKEIAGWTDKRGTRWKVGLLPLGGYVKFAGDMDATSREDPEWKALPESERNQTFQSKSLAQRAFIVFAGPAINFIAAILIFAGLALVNGQAVTPAIVENPLPDYPSAQVFEPGDKIIAIDGRQVDVLPDVSQYITYHPGRDVRITFVRGGAAQTIDYTIAAEKFTDRFGNEFSRGVIGFDPVDPEYQPIEFWQAPGIGVKATIDTLENMVTGIGQIIMGVRSVRELGGPLKIAQISGEFLNAGIEPFIVLVALISINLGFINLLPIPMLDGGHLMFYAIEAVRRKPADEMAQEWAFRLGMLLVLCFMVFVTVNDLVSFGLLGR